MPAELWSDAVALARVEGAYPVARALRLNFDALKRRVAEAGEPAGGAPPPATGFVELTGAQLLESPSTVGTIVELSDETGVRLTVRLAAGTEVDVAALVAAFRHRGGR